MEVQETFQKKTSAQNEYMSYLFYISFFSGRAPALTLGSGYCALRFRCGAALTLRTGLTPLLHIPHAGKGKGSAVISVRFATQ
ncbi:MAG: hypothetical protein RML94_02620 [Bacteroidia bacterium]|nr:hypothetical protein [Bacteroidia bacterium]